MRDAPPVLLMELQGALPNVGEEKILTNVTTLPSLPSTFITTITLKGSITTQKNVGNNT